MKRLTEVYVISRALIFPLGNVEITNLVSLFTMHIFCYFWHNRQVISMIINFASYFSTVQKL